MSKKSILRNSSNNQVKLHNAANLRRKPGISRKYLQNYRKLSKDTNPALRHQRNKNKATYTSPNTRQLTWRQLTTFPKNNRQLTWSPRNKTTFTPQNNRQPAWFQKNKTTFISSNTRQPAWFQKNKATIIPSNTRQLTKLQKTKGISQRLYSKNVKII